MAPAISSHRNIDGGRGGLQISRSMNDDATVSNAVEAARHICEEARNMLTSLRCGPPNVARGDLAQDLMDLRSNVNFGSFDNPNNIVSKKIDNFTNANNNIYNQANDDANTMNTAAEASDSCTTTATTDVTTEKTAIAATSTIAEQSAEEEKRKEEFVNHNKPTVDSSEGIAVSYRHHQQEDVGPFARPFLSIIVDPRAAGPHTLVALRGLYRLIKRGSLLPLTSTLLKMQIRKNYQNNELVGGASIDESAILPPHPYMVALEPLTKGVLSCKFEQTDAGADEAVEMAIADLLKLLITMDYCSSSESNINNNIRPETLLDAFNTVFVTRNTFVHSPALCYHFEDVLISIVTCVFSANNDSNHCLPKKFILEFLVNQLLHTPLVGGSSGGGNSNSTTQSSIVGDYMVGSSEDSREAHLAHDATRILCFRLINVALKSGWGSEEQQSYTANTENEYQNNGSTIDGLAASLQGEIIRIIQDDLCLSLLMTGQAIWTGFGVDGSGGSDGNIISLEVLSEVCNTISTLWNTLLLRPHLVAQFETIFTGFYQRALVLLQKRFVPQDSITFNMNLVFDSQCEMILESLVDILCLHNYSNNIASDNGDGGLLECLFITYDCHLKRSDVAAALVIELCRCCGGMIDEQRHLSSFLKLENKKNMDDKASCSTSNESPSSSLSSSARKQQKGDLPPNHKDADMSSVATEVTEITNTSHTSIAQNSTNNDNISSFQNDNEAMQQVHEQYVNDQQSLYRQVPPHLKEICAQALMGGMKCLFKDDHPSEETLRERSKRFSSPSNEGQQKHSDHHVRSIKARKRLMKQAAVLFNEEQTKGIEFLVSKGLVSDPITPENVASFLRNGIVLGLKKVAVGEYLGAVGKPPKINNKKQPKRWDRDWFHKEVLTIYCSLFKFEGQSLLDGLRMFLATFRLPGEAQQIDRILQAFSDLCSEVCEDRSLRLFSDDPKKASDGSYLLSFSIIMLNTDLHNDNIREDRKMKLGDFIKNNADYGRDITDKGKELPPEYLTKIYESIREEEIRTEGEGADGCMTIERWKDVLRSSQVDEVSEPLQQAGGNDTDLYQSPPVIPSMYDAEDLTELVLEQVWMPIMSAIGALWGIKTLCSDEITTSTTNSALNNNMAIPSGSTIERSQVGMLGAQGARLGMDMATEMLHGVRQLGRVDIFRKMFSCICKYTGLLDGYNMNAVDRIWKFTNSVEAQSAVIITIRTAREFGSNSDGDDIGTDEWILIFALLMELRDLKLLGRDRDSGMILLKESDADLLSKNARRDFDMFLLKGDQMKKDRTMKRPVSMLGAFSRALFGALDDLGDDNDSGYFGNSSSSGGQEPLDSDSSVARDHPSSAIPAPNPFRRERSAHRKEELILWDETAISDDENDIVSQPQAVEWGNIGNGDITDYLTVDLPAQPSPLSSGVVPLVGDTTDASIEIANSNDKQQVSPSFSYDHQNHLSVGGAFELNLIRENLLISQRNNLTTITGLERVDDRYHKQLSPRARVRNRLNRACDFHSLIAESRFMSADGVCSMIYSLLHLIYSNDNNSEQRNREQKQSLSRSVRINSKYDFPLSPASEAFAEVLISEITLRNKDRLKLLWNNMLKSHYMSRLNDMKQSLFNNRMELREVLIHTGIEKCLTGFIRLCVCAVQREREDIGNDIVSIWKFLIPDNNLGTSDTTSTPANSSLKSPSAPSSSCSLSGILDKHISEGLYRIIRNIVDYGYCHLNKDGWDGILALLYWCSTCTTKNDGSNNSEKGSLDGKNLAEDDPALQSYRSIHLLFTSSTPEVKDNIPYSIITCIEELIFTGDYRNYSQLSIAGLDLFHTFIENKINVVMARGCHDDDEDFWTSCWGSIVKISSTVAEKSYNSNVRQHALSVLTNIFLDKHGSSLIPIHHLCTYLSEVCIPLTRKRIMGLGHDRALYTDDYDSNKNQQQENDEIMIEFELCIGLIFKPLRHHLKSIIGNKDRHLLLPLWRSILLTLEQLLFQDVNEDNTDFPDDNAGESTPTRQFLGSNAFSTTMRDLANEHLCNAVSVLLTVLSTAEIEHDKKGGNPDLSAEIITLTLNSVSKMKSCQKYVEQWKQQIIDLKKSRVLQESDA